MALMGCCAQYQLALAVFPSLSEVVVSRCVRRLFRLGLIDVLRWNRVGINLLRLRAAGRDLLLDRGTPDAEIFLGRWPTASSLPHRLWIVDTYLALQEIGGFKTKLCWMLRRQFAGAKHPIPDLLAFRPSGSLLFGIEIDRGTESIRDVIIPRQLHLATFLASIAGGGTAQILFLTTGPRRAEALRSHSISAGTPVATAVLPKAVGRAAVPALRELFTRVGK